jgi:hypothetical protein
MRRHSFIIFLSSMVVFTNEVPVLAKSCQPFSERIIGRGVSEMSTADSKEACDRALQQDYSARPTAIDMAVKQFVGDMGKIRKQCKGTLETYGEENTTFADESIHVWNSYNPAVNTSFYRNCAVRANYPPRPIIADCVCGGSESRALPNTSWQPSNKELNDTAQLMAPEKTPEESALETAKPIKEAVHSPLMIQGGQSAQETNQPGNNPAQ